MIDYMKQCVRCEKLFAQCDCPDDPEHDHPFWHSFNRTMEEWARWLRAWRLFP